MNTGCVFCHTHDDNPHMYICSKCVQKFLMASAEAIIRAIELAKEKGYLEKAEAITNFTGMEVPKNGREAGTNINRTGTRRTAQLQKRADRLSKTKRKATIHKSKQ